MFLELRCPMQETTGRLFNATLQAGPRGGNCCCGRDLFHRRNRLTRAPIPPSNGRHIRLKDQVRSTGAPLGMFADFSYEPASRVILEPGKILLILCQGNFPATSRCGPCCCGGQSFSELLELQGFTESLMLIDALDRLALDNALRPV